MPRLKIIAVICCLLGSMQSAYAAGVVIPGPADASRIQMPEGRKSLPPENKNIRLPAGASPAAIPPESKETLIVLEKVRIDGSTVFSPADFEPLYKDSLGKKVPLSIAWEIANAITALYRDHGYFLSRAYVPAQEVGSGDIAINIVEGYVADVDVKGSDALGLDMDSFSRQLTGKRPVRAADIENFLLLLNDVPGHQYRAVLSRLDTAAAQDGQTRLTLIPERQKFNAQIGADNYGSRFLGPYEVSGSISGSLLPGQQTDLAFLGSVPLNELHYISVGHRLYLMPDLSLHAEGSFSDAVPGEYLKALDVKSQSFFMNAGLTYQWIRQRDENLALDVGISARNSRTDIAGTALSRDHIRSAYATARYDVADQTNGFTSMNAGLVQGIDGLGSSERNDPDVSRARAIPDFTIMTLSATHIHEMPIGIEAVASVSGQYSNDVLYSAEQFGYGGQFFGRAYDTSELSGDSGLEGSLELRYGDIDTGEFVKIVPYVFYDIGRVWNKGAGGESASGSSAGIGTHLDTTSQISANAGLAFPLTRDAETPIYKGDGKDPRFYLQVTKGF